MAVLITGGTGFMGIYLAKTLINQNQQVVLGDIRTSDNNIKDIREKVELINIDVTNITEIIKVIKMYKIKEIFHSAALLSEESELYPKKAFNVNILGIWNVLEAARLNQIKKVFFISTVATYGDYATSPIKNDAPQFPHNLYGATKVAGERLGDYYFHRFGIDFRGIRFPSVIGPGRDSGISKYTSFIIQQPTKGLPYSIYVEPDFIFSLFYIDDAINAILKLHQAPLDRLTRRIYNLTGISCSARQLVDEVKQVIPSAELTFQPKIELY